MTEDQKKIKKYVNAVERKLKVPLESQNQCGFGNRHPCEDGSRAVGR